jgi:hypothetical protein
MKNPMSVICVLVILMIWFPPDLMASEPADSIIANALTDLERYQAQAGALTPGRSANANRILKLMNLSQQRLATSPNQTDPSWVEVNDGYVALQSQLENLLNPPAADSATAAPVTPASAPPATSAAPTSAASSPSSAAAPTSTPAAASPPANGSVPELVSGQRVQVKKLARDLANSRASIVTTGPSHFQDPDNVAARQKSLQQYTDAIGRYPQLNDPDVQTARAEYQQYRDALNAEFERAKVQMEQLGDVQATLAQLKENNQSYPVPAPMVIPFTQEQASQWVQAASSARTVAEHNSEQLNIIASLAYLPDNPGTPESGAPFDSNDVRGMQNYAADSFKRVQANYEEMATQLQQRMEGMESDVLQRWQEDPTDVEKQWLFIGEGQSEEAAQLYQESRDVINSAIYLEQALDRDAIYSMGMLERLDDAEKTFKQNQQLALENSRLPEPVSSDKEMMKIAEDILSSPRYEFGVYGDIILRSKNIDEREREDSEIELDDADLSLSGELTLSGTQTTWIYKWKEFKFATALKETDSDEWYIWWITAKNFSSGGARTPLNKWVSGETTKGNRILEKNL